MTSSILELKNVSKAIGGRRILKSFTFSFEPGRRYLLLGANGSGKTTLCKVMAGLWRPTSGTVCYQGQNIADLNGSYTKEIGFLSHELGMYEELTGFQNLKFFAELYGVPQPGARAFELLELFGLQFFAHEKVKSYSRGMKQRLVIAKALLHSPKILLFDEPFAGLDLQGTELLMELIPLVLPSDGLLILSSHDLALGWRAADAFLYLERGVLLAYGDQARYAGERIEQRLTSAKEVGVY